MNATDTAASPWRIGLRPLLAGGILLGGGILRFIEPHWADRLWMAGLLALGTPLAFRTFRGLLLGRLASDVVASLAIVASIGLWMPLAGLTVVLMQTGGEALERRAEGRASAAVEALVAAAPRLAHRLGAAEATDVPVDDVQVGDRLVVRPGELVPCDGRVLEGSGALDLSRLTGEPLPVAVAAGTRVRSGSGVLDAPLVLAVDRPAAASEYARIVAMVRQAQASKAPLQRIADRYAVWFTPLAVAVAAVAWLASRDPARALAVLVVATPCPMILATPVAIMGGIGRAARQGVIFRRGAGLEAAAAVTAAIIDKTGTLTLGHPEVARVVPRTPFTEAEVLTLAASVERGSGHALARTIEQAAAKRGLPVAAPEDTKDVAGRGVIGTVGGATVAVGGLEFVSGYAPEAGQAFRLSGVSGNAGLRAYVSINGAAAATIEFADRPRPEAGAALARLRALGVHPLLLLSGDARAATEALGAALGLDEARGEQLPGDKLAAVATLRRAGARVLMVGDGVNDAPALSAADVGIALAAGGGGISAEAADVVVLTDDLNAVPEAIRIGRRTMRIARQSLWVGLGLSAVAMAFAAAGQIPPTVGAVLQEGIDVAVILNAVRASGEGIA